MSSQIASLDGLTKRFGPKAGVSDLSMEIPPRATLGLIGPSGSGKTTTVRLLNGLTAPDSGSVSVLGKEPVRFDAKTRGRIGYMPQHAILYPDLTLAQNLWFLASLYGLGRRARARYDSLVDFLDLESAMDRRPDEASGGERRRLMLAATLMHRPELLFLDEPTAGIDPVLRRRIWDRLNEVVADGASLVVTTQYVGEAAYCDRVAVLAEGHIIALDSPEGLRRRAYDGELIDVVLEKPATPQQIASLERATDGNAESIDETTIRLTVPDAGEAGPLIGDWSQGDDRVKVLESEKHVPSFDDVFVVLVDRLSAADDDSEPSKPEGPGLGI